MMNFDFGANLRALRNSKCLTQEQAAELLNISKQSVSRWENGTTFPDITFLPQLASFYGVSVDALLGVDEPVRQAVLKEYGIAHVEAHNRGDINAAYELSRTLYARFPNEHQSMSNLINDAYLLGKMSEGTKKREYLNEALTVAERFSKMTEDLEERCRCIHYCARCCKLLEQPEQAREWLFRLPSVWSCIDLCAIEVFEGKELREHLQSTITDHIDILQKLIFASASLPDREADERRTILEKIPRVLDILFEDGDYGEFSSVLTKTYCELAKLTRENEKQQDGRNALTTAESLDASTIGIHRSVLFRGMAYSSKEAFKTEQ
jgi:transcriptional regulator with XRE-family HTH domain